MGGQKGRGLKTGSNHRSQDKADSIRLYGFFCVVEESFFFRCCCRLLLPFVSPPPAPRFSLSAFGPLPHGSLLLGKHRLVPNHSLKSMYS